jgi:transposase InsO family protein
LFERTCREFGITARLTRRHSPTTTSKIERFHRTLRREFLDEAGAFADIAAAHAALDATMPDGQSPCGSTWSAFTSSSTAIACSSASTARECE